MWVKCDWQAGAVMGTCGIGEKAPVLTRGERALYISGGTGKGRTLKILVLQNHP